MSLAIKWGNFEDIDSFSGMIYLDATTSYSQEYKGQVTKHPIDAPASVVDHYYKENPIFNISGVVSGVDLSSIPSSLRSDDGMFASNSRSQPFSVYFEEKGKDLLQYLPGSISQFLGKKSERPIVDLSPRTDFNSEIIARDFLKAVMEPFRYNPRTGKFESYIQLVSLYEFDGTNITNITNDLVITSLRFREDVQSGDALWMDVTLEQVQFAFLREAIIPKDVIKALKKKSEDKKNKGKVSSTSKDCAAAQESGDSTAPQTPAGDDVSGAKADDSAISKKTLKALFGE